MKEGQARVPCLSWWWGYSDNDDGDGIGAGGWDGLGSIWRDGDGWVGAVMMAVARLEDRLR